jgi:hypothetical protein
MTTVTQTRLALAALSLGGVYFGLTWFFFGSAHPCGILEARQRPYVVNRYTDDSVELVLRFGTAALLSIVENAGHAPKRAVRDLHERIQNHYTPARCVWEAMAWNPDPYKESPSLRDMFKTGQQRK